MYAMRILLVSMGIILSNISHIDLRISYSKGYVTSNTHCTRPIWYMYTVKARNKAPGGNISKQPKAK